MRSFLIVLAVIFLPTLARGQDAPSQSAVIELVGVGSPTIELSLQ
jgi:hypothetical protein